MSKKQLIYISAMLLPIAAVVTAVSLAWFSTSETHGGSYINVGAFHAVVSIDEKETSATYQKVLTPTVFGGNDGDSRFNEVAQAVPVTVTNGGETDVQLRFTVEAGAVLHYAVVDSDTMPDIAAALTALGIDETNWKEKADAALAVLNGTVLAAKTGHKNFFVIYWLCYTCAGYGGETKPPVTGERTNIVLRAKALQTEG